MICRNCGKEIEENSTFCIFCGASQQAEPAAPAPVEEEQPKKKKGCLIAAIIAIVAGILVGTVLLVIVAAVAIMAVYTVKEPVQVMPGSSYEDIWDEDDYYEGDLDVWEEDGIHYEVIPDVQVEEPVWNVNSPYRAVAEKYGMFVFPESNYEYLSIDMLEGMTMEELLIAWGEIYARRGYIFNEPYLDEYFNNSIWYTPITDDFNDLDLNEWELANILLINEYLASITQ